MAEDGKTSTSKHRLIEENLKRVYQEMVDEDVPDRFTDLLKRLKSAEKGEASDK
jgi:hypothetical protein